MSCWGLFCLELQKYRWKVKVRKNSELDLETIVREISLDKHLVVLSSGL